MTYRIVQEALTNTATHAHAKTAEVVLSGHDSECVLTISDDGRGFDTQILDTDNRKTVSFGLLNIRQQVDNRNGTFEIKSIPSKGTRLRVMIPWRR